MRGEALNGFISYHIEKYIDNKGVDARSFIRSLNEAVGKFLS